MKRAGYTLIEVMTAVVVMTVGATGIVAMQGAAVRANQDANETSNAINFASTWIERIKRDSRLWITTGSADLANTAWLNNATAGDVANPSWFVPTTIAPEQAAADIFGYDTPNEFTTQTDADAPLAYFCVNLRMSVTQAFNVASPTVVAPATDANAIRADVRVWWYRNSSDANRSARTCRSGALNAAQLASYAYRKTYLSNVVSWRAPGWP